MEHGYWGVSTSTVDFCEPNYVHSKYIAEFFNTLSSIPIVLAGANGIYLSYREKLGTELLVCYGILIVVGLGSVAFHATLLRWGQVLDELPMLWGALLFIHAIILAQDFRLKQSRINRQSFPKKPSTFFEGSLDKTRIGLAIWGCIATFVYFSFGFTIFVLIYISCVSTLVFLCTKVTFLGRVKTPDRTRHLMIAAFCCYVGGFLLLWIPGEVFCRHLPFVERLPLHAIFHLTSTAGPHLLLTATALVKHQVENPRSPNSMLFMWLPVAKRRWAKEP